MESSGMAYISQRGEYWRAEIRKRGYKPVYHTFDTQRQAEQWARRIARWLANDLSYRTLASLRGADFARYRDHRRAAGRAENTIRLELQVIRHLFEIARK